MGPGTMERLLPGIMWPKEQVREKGMQYLPAVALLLGSAVALLRSAIALLLGLEAGLLVATVAALLLETGLLVAAGLLETRLLAVATVAASAAVSVSTVLSSDTAVATTHTASGAGVGHVDTDASTVELLLVESGDGGVSLLLGGEGDKAKTTGAAGLTVLHDDVVGELAVSRKGVGEAVIGGVPREVSNVNFGGHLELGSESRRDIKVSKDYL